MAAIPDGHAALPQLLGELHYEDGRLCGHADEEHDADLGVHVHVHLPDEERQNRTHQCQRYHQDDSQNLAGKGGRSSTPGFGGHDEPAPTLRFRITPRIFAGWEHIFVPTANANGFRPR